jgi:hypothetical protein
VQTDATALDLIYTDLPARFPPLYEELILSHHWLTSSSKISLCKRIRPAKD